MSDSSTALSCTPNQTPQPQKLAEAPSLLFSATTSRLPRPGNRATASRCAGFRGANTSRTTPKMIRESTSARKIRQTTVSYAARILSNTGAEGLWKSGRMKFQRLGRRSRANPRNQVQLLLRRTNGARGYSEDSDPPRTVTRRSFTEAFYVLEMELGTLRPLDSLPKASAHTALSGAARWHFRVPMLVLRTDILGYRRTHCLLCTIYCWSAPGIGCQQYNIAFCSCPAKWRVSRQADPYSVISFGVRPRVGSCVPCIRHIIRCNLLLETHTLACGENGQRWTKIPGYEPG